MGVNIILFKINGVVNVSVIVMIFGVGKLMFFFVVRQMSGVVRYVELVNSSGNVLVGNGEEVMFVVVNILVNLVLFDLFKLIVEMNIGVDYIVQILGVMVQVYWNNIQVFGW